MKALNNFITWLYIMFTVAAGLVIILSSGNIYNLRGIVNSITIDWFTGPAGIWTGLAVVMLGMLFFSLRIKAGYTPKTISFDNPEGEVTISIRAIEDFVKRIGHEFPDVQELSSFILPSHNGIKVSLKTTITANANVPNLAETIQNTIKAKMQNILGIENITSVELHISKLANIKAQKTKPIEQKQINFTEK